MAKALVAYFSASGVTKKVAERLAKVADADLFEIVPEVAYTAADLNWRDSKSRSSQEMGDRSSRPAIASRIDDVDVYDTIYVGFPIWWYREPSIVDTFLEAYDFAGKTLVPFATSGSSGIGEVSANFRVLVPAAAVAEGRRVAASVSESELSSWVETI